ncbi:MAG: hypothetical protein IBJ19_14400, partial [Gemmatimonadaceae bacterium]|nr:hypothetical protein [Gemmatimonadaceae bacterium]
MTDWDKELAKIDKQLASISDEQLMASAQQAPAAAKGAASATKALPAAGRAATAASASSSSALATGAGRPWVAWLKVTVAVTAAAGLMFWPWPARCGLPLIGFTAATGGVAVLGLWSAIGTWRHRLGLAHVASLLVTMWGLGLGRREALPHVGYAIPTQRRAARCGGDGRQRLARCHRPLNAERALLVPGAADP